MKPQSMVRIAVLGLALAGAACTGNAAVDVLHPEADPLMTVAAVDGLDRVRVEGRDGSLAVRVGRDDRVRVRVVLDGCGERFGLATRASGGTLTLAVEPSTKDRCDESWTLEVPPRLAVSGTLDRADVEVEGPEGGVELAVGKGTLRIDVPRGDVRARVANGDVVARTATRSHGRVDVHAQVGTVDVSVDGGRIRHERPHGPGDRLRIDGSGRDLITLRSIVGNVRLAIR